jgi:hypothetical protein
MGVGIYYFYHGFGLEAFEKIEKKTNCQISGTKIYLDCTTNITRGGFRGGVRGVRPRKIRKAYVIQR